MITPQPGDLFLQIFAHRINTWEDDDLSAMDSLDWGAVWIKCCQITKRIAAAQELADSANSVAPMTPPGWTP